MSYLDKTYPAGTRVRCVTDAGWSHLVFAGPIAGDVYSLSAPYTPGEGWMTLSGFTGIWSAGSFRIIGTPKMPSVKEQKKDEPVDYRAFGSRSGYQPKAKDNVNLPEHYAHFKIEPVRFCMENKLDPFQFNVIKYICRHDSKNGIEDIDKVIRYATMYRKFLLGDADWWKA